MIKHLSLVALAAFATPAFAQSFVTDTINGTPGFGSVIDSGPAALSSATIDANMADLHAAAAGIGCTSEAWAGTWVRGRSPRLQGATETGGTVSGPNITNGTVDGVPFSASLATGGGLAGSTSDGHDLIGFFHRLNTNRSIWYGVEVTCGAGPTPTVLPAEEPVDGVPAVLDFTGYNVIPASSAEGAIAQLAAGGQTDIVPGDVIAICPGSPAVAFNDFEPWSGHVFDIVVPDVIVVGDGIHVGTGFFSSNLVVIMSGTSRVLTFSGSEPPGVLVVEEGTEFVAPTDTLGSTISPYPFDYVLPSIDFGNAFDGCP